MEKNPCVADLLIHFNESGILDKNSFDIELAQPDYFMRNHTRETSLRWNPMQTNIIIYSNDFK